MTAPPVAKPVAFIPVSIPWGMQMPGIKVNGQEWLPSGNMGRFETEWKFEEQGETVRGMIIKVVAGSLSYHALLMLRNGVVVDSPNVPWASFHAAAECAEECIRNRIEFGCFVRGLPLLNGRYDLVSPDHGDCMTVTKAISRPDSFDLVYWEYGHPLRPSKVVQFGEMNIVPVETFCPPGKLLLQATSRYGWVCKRKGCVGAVTWDGGEHYSWAIHKYTEEGLSGDVAMKIPHAVEWLDCLQGMRNGFRELGA